MTLRDLWQELACASDDSGPITVFRKFAESTVCDAFVGLEGQSGRRFFAIDSEGAEIQEEELPTPQGFQVSLSTSGITRSGRSLLMVLDDAQYSNEFNALISEVVDSANEGAAPADAVLLVIETVRRWQRFLEVVKPDGLSFEAQIGLAGELMVIRDFLVPSIGSGQAIRAWKGPLQDSKDIQSNNSAVEIKTTIQAVPQTIRISSELQLDDSGLNKLFLVLNSIELTHDAGESLPELVDDLSGMAAEVGASQYLGQMLFEAGYHDIHAHMYLSSHYLPRTITGFQVTPGFPRLIEDQLPEGVGSLNYSISLSHCSQFMVSQEDIGLALKV